MDETTPFIIVAVLISLVAGIFLVTFSNPLNEWLGWTFLGLAVFLTAFQFTVK